MATQMCETVKEQIVISSAIKDLYENENRNAIIDNEHIRVLKPKEELFLAKLIAFSEANWKGSNFKLSKLCKALGHSTSQTYRKIKLLTGKAPNTFMREFRLFKALDLLHRQQGNISEIAFETGFNSPAYFTKCFYDAFGILPSKYIQLF
jgi:AraC-like DNA-binding protein